MRFSDHGTTPRAMAEELRAMTSSERICSRLDAELSTLTEALRSTVPVRTGLLKSSGYWTSEHGEDEWEGTITFGTGVHYAVYVMNREPNEFDQVVRSWEPRFEEALDLNQ